MKKGNPWALLPILCFLVVFIGMGVWLNDFLRYAGNRRISNRPRGGFLSEPKNAPFRKKMEDVTHSMGGFQCDDYVSGLCNGWGIFRRSTGCRRRRQHSNFSLSILPALLLR